LKIWPEKYSPPPCQNFSLLTYPKTNIFKFPLARVNFSRKKIFFVDVLCNLKVTGKTFLISLRRLIKYLQVIVHSYEHFLVSIKDLVNVNEAAGTVVFSYRAWGGASKNALRGKNWKNQIVANGYKTYLRL